MNFFHQLFNPHCEHCAQERNLTINILQTELAKVQRENEVLLAKLLEKPEVKVEEPKVAPSGGMMVGKPIMSWTARRQILEAEARNAARVEAEKNKELTVEQLEKELGVENG